MCGVNRHQAQYGDIERGGIGARAAGYEKIQESDDEGTAGDEGLSGGTIRRHGELAPEPCWVSGASLRHVLHGAGEGGALRAPFEPPVLRRRQGRLVDGLGPRDMLAVVPLGEPRRE